MDALLRKLWGGVVGGLQEAKACR